MLKIIACDDDVAFLDRLHRMIDRWSTETGTAVDGAPGTRGEGRAGPVTFYYQRPGLFQAALDIVGVILDYGRVVFLFEQRGGDQEVGC